MTDEGGLSTADADRLLAVHGHNEIARAVRRGPVRVFFGQFKGALVWLLLGACVLSTFLGDLADSIVIGVIVLLNAIVGFAQEYRAEGAVYALRRMTAPHARVLRDGQLKDVEARAVVPGDVLALEAGDLVAADAELLRAARLQTNEASLTGESTPVEKRVGGSTAGAALADRAGDVFMGTSVSSGTGRARVSATGMGTQLGHVANLLESAVDVETPLQRRLERVGRSLLLVCIVLVAVIGGIGLLRGQPWSEVAMSSVALAVAAVPEGLAAIVTIALAVGVQRLVQRHVLVRRLPSVETLGTTTVICTDKTGTLTTGLMSVREVWGTDPRRVLDVGASCCDASIEGEAPVGDPTELAILEAAFARGIERGAIERDRPRAAELPFDAERKRMSVLRQDGSLSVKGAVEGLLPLCTAAQGGHDVEAALAVTREWASRGLRVLAVCERRGAALEPPDLAEQDLELVGLVGIADPPRAEAIAAVAAARRAGIHTVMITGDHASTASAIGRELGILRPGAEGQADEAALGIPLVHARATPEDKLRIVRGLRERGHIVAMTGDGVNDAPALREAHIGIAMGKAGTEVTREAADMVLTDDNFASIVEAVREGRAVYANIQKTLVYALCGNAGELILMLGSALVGLPMPLSALQMLWVNLVTDGLPGLALVADPTPADALNTPPRPVNEPMLGRPQWTRILVVGTLEAGVVLGVYLWALRTHDLTVARTLALTTCIFSQVLRAFAARSTTSLLPEVGIFTNARLVIVIAVSLLAQVALVYFPPTRALFSLGVPSPGDFGVACAFGLVAVSVLEVSKLVARALRRRRDAT